MNKVAKSSQFIDSDFSKLQNQDSLRKITSTELTKSENYVGSRTFTGDGVMAQ